MFHLLAALLITTAHASDYQQCSTNSTCTIGEFLYDNNSSPLPGQSCQLNAKYPGGTAFITNQALTSRSDGWYSYDTNPGATEGLYTATICCNPPGGAMCLDKSFEVKSPSGSSLTPAAIWGYSDRTLTGYGTLVSDIWNYSARSLTSFGSLVSDIWGYSNKTLTSFNFATNTPTTSASGSPNTLSAIVKEQQTQRALLEKLVNAPVISLSLGDGAAIPDLQSKLDESKKQASLLYDTISTAKSRLMVLDSKWDHLTADATTKEITAVSSLFQNQEPLVALTKSWDTPSLATINQEATGLKSSLADLLTSASLSKTPLSPASLTASLEHLSNMETTLGDSTNSSSDKTLFGYLAKVNDRDASLQGESQKLSAMLEDLNGQGTLVATKEIGSIKDRLLTLNEYPGGASLATPAKLSDDPKLNLKNILFSLQALVGLNHQIMAMNVGDPIRSLWLEEGSIIFRAVITNPSSIISQSVPLKFYLPRELKTEDIITLDPSLTTTYDPTQEALYVSGTYNLKPGETKLVFVETQDIWRLESAQIETLRTQATNLLKPLEKTAYFSQGTTLKSDIDVTLDKVALNTSKAVTPENRIRSYREAKLELTKVDSSMNRLQDLVAQSSGTGSLFGFVGGVQTTAVWGILLVVVAGFVFLSIYFKKLQSTEKAIAPSEPVETVKEPATRLSRLDIIQSKPAPSWQMPAIIVAVVIVTAGSTIYLTQLAKPKNSPVVNQVVVAPSPTEAPSPSPSPANNEIEVKSEKSVLGQTTEKAPGSSTLQYTLAVPTDSTVNVRNKPSSSADIVMAIKTSQDVYVFQTKDEWDQIGFAKTDSTKGYWVNTKFIIEK